jgi:hypothetical protein
MKMTNKMQLCRIIYCSLTAVHVSSDKFAHHQEHLNCITAAVIILMCCYRLISSLIIFSLDISRQRHTCVIPEAVHTV